MNQVSRNSDYSSKIISEYYRISRNSDYSSKIISEHHQISIKRNVLCRLQSYNDYFEMDETERSLLSGSHIFNIYLFENSQQGKQACAYTAILMHYAVRYESMDTIDTFFDSLNEDLLSPWSLVALLRSTFTYRRRISQWKKLYDIAYDKVVEDGRDPKRTLYGLDA